MRGSAQADKIYIWNYDDGVGISSQKFTMLEKARAGGVVLAYSSQNKNFIIVDESIPSGTDRIAIIDLEGHLTSGKLSGTIAGDWLGKTLIRYSASDIDKNGYPGRLPLGTFVGDATSSIAHLYELDIQTETGVLKIK
jgi:hypothetical protein